MVKMESNEGKVLLSCKGTYNEVIADMSCLLGSLIYNVAKKFEVDCEDVAKDVGEYLPDVLLELYNRDDES